MKTFGIDKLLNSYNAEGKTLESFKEENAVMDSITNHFTAMGEDIIFLSLCEVEEWQMPGRAMFYILSKENITDFLVQGKPLKRGTIPLNLIGEELFEELKRTTGLIAVIKNQKYLVSDCAIKTLTLRSTVSGDMTIERQNLIRNLHFADAIITRNDRIHFVYREINTKNSKGEIIQIRKIFAALGLKYTAVPQTILTDCANMLIKDGFLGKTTVNNWQVNHIISSVSLSFPDVAAEMCKTYKLPEAGISPGVLLITSDIGYSSIIARGVFFKGRDYIITDEVVIKHMGHITPEKIIKRVNEDIFPHIRELPEVLSYLMGESVLDYSAIKLSTSRGRARNRNMVKWLYAKVINKAFKKVLSKKQQIALTNCLCAEINSEIPYTLYDIAVAFMTITDRIRGLDTTDEITELRRACGRVPYILKDLKLSEIKEEEVEEEIYLLPE